MIVCGTIEYTTNANVALGPAVSAWQTAYLMWVTITVKTAGTTSRVQVTRGTGGTAVARLGTAAADASLHQNWATNDPIVPGISAGKGVQFYVDRSGVAPAVIEVSYAIAVKG